MAKSWMVDKIPSSQCYMHLIIHPFINEGLKFGENIKRQRTVMLFLCFFFRLCLKWFIFYIYFSTTPIPKKFNTQFQGIKEPSTIHNTIKRFTESGQISAGKGHWKPVTFDQSGSTALKKNSMTVYEDITTWAQKHWKTIVSKYNSSLHLQMQVKSDPTM